MSTTNTTSNYGLPVYSTSDKLAVLQDFNNAMTLIDSALHSLNTAITTIDGTVTDQGSAGESYQSSIETLQTQVLANTTSVSNMQTNVLSNTTNISSLQTQNGSATLSTDAQTLSGAVNEIKTVLDNHRVDNQQGYQALLCTTISDQSTWTQCTLNNNLTDDKARLVHISVIDANNIYNTITIPVKVALNHNDSTHCFHVDVPSQEGYNYCQVCFLNDTTIAYTMTRSNSNVGVKGLYITASY